MDEPVLRIECMVISVHPTYDQHGNEYVCVEFGFKPPKKPQVLTVPADAPEELKIAAPIIAQIPKLFQIPQMTGVTAAGLPYSSLYFSQGIVE